MLYAKDTTYTVLLYSYVTAARVTNDSIGPEARTTMTKWDSADEIGPKARANNDRRGLRISDTGMTRRKTKGQPKHCYSHNWKA